MSGLISVIIPIYKVEPYLNHCIQSIVDQTYTHLEIILVNDGSPDQCPAICDEWAKKDTRIKVIHQNNSGLSAARNAGIDLATGEYLGFVDSDDYIAPDMYEKLFIALTDNQADIAICNLKKVCPDGSIYDIINQPLENCVFETEQALTKINEHWLYVIQCNKLYKKDLFNHYRLPVGRIHEDEFSVHHLFSSATRIVCISDELYYYVQRENSIMSTEWTPRKLDYIYALYDRYELYRATNRDNLKLITLSMIHLQTKHNITHMKHFFDQKNYFKLLCKSGIIFAKEKDSRLFNIILQYIKQLAKPVLLPLYRTMQVNKLFSKVRSPKIIIMATPEHGNLGDHAIVMAEKQLLCQLYPQWPIVEIPNSRYMVLRDHLHKRIHKNDIIVIDGGGSLGSLWPWEDDKITDIIDRFKGNRIVIFPQTCFYNNSDLQTRLFRNKAIYESAPKLTVMLRDRASYEFFLKHFPKTRAMFIPDAVLSLKPDFHTTDRAGVLLCLRKDKERIISDTIKKQIEDTLDRMNLSYSLTSTVLDNDISASQRENAVNAKLKEFSGAKLLITDRLHGMIFATITHTPCIAVDNISNKVGGVYEWIKDLPYICYLDDASLIPESIDRMLSIKEVSSEYKYPIDKIDVS